MRTTLFFWRKAADGRRRRDRNFRRAIRLSCFRSKKRCFRAMWKWVSRGMLLPLAIFKIKRRHVLANHLALWLDFVEQDRLDQAANHEQYVCGPHSTAQHSTAQQRGRGGVGCCFVETRRSLLVWPENDPPECCDAFVVPACLPVRERRQSAAATLHCTALPREVHFFMFAVCMEWNYPTCGAD